VLLDERGRWVRPRVPVDECGKPRTEVRAAIHGLRLTRTSARAIGQVESAEAAVAGCDQHWSDVVWAIASLGTTSGAAAPAALYAGPAPVRTCVYRVPTELDCCRRVLAPATAGHDILRQGSATLLALLAGR
jgi:hypothetical protein